MHRYKVLAATESTGIVAVLDVDGRCHVGRAMGNVPTPDKELHGQAPAVGLRTMRVVGSEEPCPLALVLLDCDPAIAARVVLPVDVEWPLRPPRC